MNIIGKVARGDGVGSILGYPTANIGFNKKLNHGVYTAYCVIEERTYRAVAIYGVKGKLAIEVFILDFKGDLYDKEIDLEILSKISEIEQFEKQEDLIKKMEGDIDLARKYFNRLCSRA